MSHNDDVFHCPFKSFTVPAFSNLFKINPLFKTDPFKK